MPLPDGSKGACATRAWGYGPVRQLPAVGCAQVDGRGELFSGTRQGNCIDGATATRYPKPAAARNASNGRTEQRGMGERAQSGAFRSIFHP